MLLSPRKLMRHFTIHRTKANLDQHLDRLEEMVSRAGGVVHRAKDGAEATAIMAGRRRVSNEAVAAGVTNMASIRAMPTTCRAATMRRPSVTRISSAWCTMPCAG